jgi:hypothetical protein
LITENALIKIFNISCINITTHAQTVAPDFVLKIVQLWNVGYKVALFLRERVKRLEVFHATGVYRLTDAGLATLAVV